MKISKIAILFFVVILSVSAAIAQENSGTSKKVEFTVGGNFLWEGGLLPRMGGTSPSAPYYMISGEAKFTRHSGIELDFALRNKNGTNYLSIPLMYKYYSRILNFSAGVNVDIPVGEIKTFPNCTPIGIVLRISKNIKIYKGLYIEPVIQFNPTFSTPYGSMGVEEFWLGGGVGIKYKF